MYTRVLFNARLFSLYYLLILFNRANFYEIILIIHSEYIYLENFPFRHFSLLLYHYNTIGMYGLSIYIRPYVLYYILCITLYVEVFVNRERSSNGITITYEGIDFVILLYYTYWLEIRNFSKKTKTCQK